MGKKSWGEEVEELEKMEEEEEREKRKNQVQDMSREKSKKDQEEVSQELQWESLDEEEMMEVNLGPRVQVKRVGDESNASKKKNNNGFIN
ncbi:hypothetical protein XELAEV_18041181mg [Xenopus laevis]|uniref:Uncharacterized protein n=1 Tax=Xenopus laevis TaxID=8355 RepID=A0A974C1N0_XENLA|nr:hypothetical protein XELAEV_18041181mg [Xenopus laevis]